MTERKPVLIAENGKNASKGENREGGTNAGKFVEIDAKGVRFATVQKAPGAFPDWN